MYVKEDLVEDQMMATVKDHLAVIRFDLQRNINYVSEPFAQTIGYSPSQLLTTAITNSYEQVEQTFQEFQQMQHISTAVKVQSDQLNRLI